MMTLTSFTLLLALWNSSPVLPAQECPAGKHGVIITTIPPTEECQDD